MGHKRHFSFFSFESPTLREASCHVMRTFKQLVEEPQLGKNLGLLPTMWISYLGNRSSGSRKPFRWYSWCTNLDCNFTSWEVLNQGCLINPLPNFWPTKLRALLNTYYCLKPLSGGIIRYIAVDNWYTCEDFPRVTYICFYLHPYVFLFWDTQTHKKLSHIHQ